MATWDGHKYFQKIMAPLCEGGKELTMVWHTPFVLSLAQVKKERLLCSLHKWIPDAGERWELESRLAKETFFRARFEAKQKPISRPCPSLACLLSSSLFSSGGGHGGATAAAAHYAALPPQPAVNSHQRNPLFQSTSLTISAFARLSELKWVQVGHPNPHQILAAVQVKSSPSKDIVYYFPPSDS